MTRAVTILGAVSVAGLLLLAAVLVVAASLVYWNWRTGVPPHPSTRAERRAVVELLRQAGVGPGAVYELGCGWGGLARRLARAFRAQRVVGVELSPFVALWAKLTSLGRHNLRIVHGDLMQTPLSDAAAVVCYLMIDATQVLAPKLDRELARGTPVVSIAFQFRGRQPAAKRTPSRWLPGDVQLYRW